jgi:hypothetical protein
MMSDQAEVLVGIDVGKTWLDVAWLRPDETPTTRHIGTPARSVSTGCP